VISLDINEIFEGEVLDDGVADGEIEGLGVARVPGIRGIVDSVMRMPAIWP